MMNKIYYWQGFIVMLCNDQSLIVTPKNGIGKAEKVTADNPLYQMIRLAIVGHKTKKAEF